MKHFLLSFKDSSKFFNVKRKMKMNCNTNLLIWPRSIKNFKSNIILLRMELNPEISLKTITWNYKATLNNLKKKIKN